ncbi:MAG: hypothetical protein CMM77_08340 [Rhodospirillaceae bacterium]|nr:hypothetical protein [Rhodospirillaceae bacterium]
MTEWRKPDWEPRVGAGFRVLVAGASGGIGRATVDMLQRSPGAVIGVHGRDAANLPAGPNIHPVVSAASSADDAEAIVGDFVNAVGGIDGLVVLTGGIANPGHWRDQDADDWRHDIDLNLSLPFFLARAAMRHMGDGPGRIVLNGTESSLHGGSPTSLAYGVAKHGVECLVKGMAREGAANHITVNGIRFGYIDSGFHARWQNQTADQHARRVAMIPLGRAGQVDEAAALIVYLLSGYGAFITGQMMSLTGGDWL